MDVLLQTGNALDQDRQTLQLVIGGLLIVAALLGVLTIWYWRQTNPKRALSNPPASHLEEPYDDVYYEDEADFFEREPNQPPGLAGGSVVSHGSGRRAPVADPDDEWAALTSADRNDY